MCLRDEGRGETLLKATRIDADVRRIMKKC